MRAQTILIVEDDREIRQLLADFLTREGFRIATAENGTAVDWEMERAEPDLVILDLMLPDEDGLSICRRLRQKSAVPILMLTAKTDEVDRIVGLELGADDYLGKPFHPRELLARIRAILRRVETTARQAEERLVGEAGRQLLAFDAFRIDIDGRRLTTEDGAGVLLTAAEFDLLACFVTRPRRVLSRDQLLDWTRGRSADPLDRTIDVTVSRLRRRLDAAAANAGDLITTVRNGGYLFAADVRSVA